MILIKKTRIPITQRCLVPTVVENGPSFLEEDYWILSMCVCHVANISPWKRAWPFILTNLNPLHAKKLCAKFTKIGTSALEKKSLNFVNVFSPSPWKRAWSFIWKYKTWIPFTKASLVQSLDEIVSLFSGEEDEMRKVYDNNEDSINNNEDGLRLRWAKIMYIEKKINWTIQRVALK